MISHKIQLLTYYDINTKELVNSAAAFLGQLALPQIIEKLRVTIKRESCYIKVFGKEFRDCFGLNRTPPLMPSADYCRVISYYIYLVTGQNKYWDIVGTPSHWWLVHRSTGKKLDATYDQFPKGFDYSDGKSQLAMLAFDKHEESLLRNQAIILGRLARLAHVI